MTPAVDYNIGRLREIKIKHSVEEWYKSSTTPYKVSCYINIIGIHRHNFIIRVQESKTMIKKELVDYLELKHPSLVYAFSLSHNSLSIFIKPVDNE